MVVGAVVAVALRTCVNPSGFVQAAPTRIRQQLETELVAWLFGGPVAASVAAAIAFARWHLGRARCGALAATLVGAATFTAFGASVVGIGTGWLANLVPDTSRAAAVLALPLTPPGVLSGELSVVALAGTVRRLRGRRGRRARRLVPCSEFY